MSSQLIAWNNYVVTAALSASSADPSHPVTNLADPTGAPSAAWQTAAGVVSGAATSFDIGLGDPTGGYVEDPSGGYVGDPSGYTVVGVQLQIVPSLRGQTWRVFGLFRTNLTASANVTFALFNGYPGNGLLVWQISVPGPVLGYGQVVAVAPTDQVGDYATISIDDPSNPQGFLNIPLCFAGPAWQIETGADFATVWGLDNLNSEVVSRGGQEYTDMKWYRRRWEVVLPGVRPSELFAIAEINRCAQWAANILWVPDYLNDQSLRAEATFGRVTSTADVGYGASNRRVWKFRVQERL